MATTAPPAADTKKPATPAPSKAGAESDKSKSAGPSTKAGGADKGEHKGQAPSAGQDKAKGAGAADGGDKAAATGGQQRFDRMAVRAKLAVSEPGDAVEREADEIAARVMRAPAAAKAPEKKPVDGVGKAAGKAAAADKLQRMTSAAPVQSDEKKGTPASGQPAPAAAGTRAGKEIQRQAKPDAARTGEKPPAAEGNAPSTPADLIARLGQGEPLDADARAFFEQRLGRDLSDVRIHNDEAAADAARSLQARAFTWGNHVAFASGDYQPASEAGRQLLAHELAHVLQNDTMSLSHVVARKPDPKFKDPNDISKDAFDPAKDKTARPALETLKLPAIKARHADYYKKLAGKSLKRPAGYDRKTPPFQTHQVKKWKEAIDLSAFYAGVGFVPGTSGQTLTFYGAKNQSLKGTDGEFIEQMKIPKWTPDGSWLSAALQVDHIVEVQVGGVDEFDNYELLTGAHNTNVGSLLRASIYANVKGYLAATEKNTGDVLVKKYIDENDVEFKKVEGGGEGKNLEKTAQFWGRQEIVGGKHLKWLKDEERAKKDEGTDKTRFALYSYTGNGFIDAFPLNKTKVAVADSGRLAGIKIQSITLNPGFDSVTGGSVGQLKGSWDLPSTVKANKGKTFESTLNSVAGKKYAGALSSLTPPEVDVEGASPVSFTEINFVRGKLSADGTLTTSHPLFSGIAIPVRWRGDDFAFEHTFSIDQLAGKLPIPGVTIDEASLTLFFGAKGLGADGSVSFTIKGFGAGLLSLGVKQGAKGPDLTAKGSLTADRKLFDLATVEIGYSTEKGMFGSGTLGITNPEKIKGIKSAKLSAKYEKSVFTATGDVEPDIPGLKAASLSVTYGKDTLLITGKLGIDDKVPGVEKADITVTVKQAEAGWKVGASGEVTPKLPGLAGAQLTFSYDDGSVLVEGEFTIKKGPLDGKVKAGVTNAVVDDKGVRSDKGSGDGFKVFGAADIKAEFIKDKLDGNLKLRLLPDGSVRVGGGLKAKDFEVFGKYPKDGGEFLNKTFSTPPVPLPGLGFSVGPVSVGITFSASLTAKAHASVGPGKLSGITLKIEEFDPAKVDMNTLEIGGGAQFDVFADAGFGASAQVNLIFGAAVAELVGSVGVEATVGIPADKPVISAVSNFTYSQAKGLDIMNTLKLSLNPELKFRLFGQVAARINVVVDTITVWSKDFTLAEANYKLPVAINASGSLGYNSKTGKITPENPSDAIKVDQPKLDGDMMKGVVMGDSAPPAVKTVDDSGKEAVPTKPGVTPKREKGRGEKAQEGQAQDEPPVPTAVDDSVVERLGTGVPLELATRGYFEQRMKGDLSRVLIHTGPKAAREADRLSAKAFTIGDHIAFAKGEYQPNTPEGQELIAHELAHVVQQQGGSAEPIVMRWPAVERTAAQTAETPATIRARTLSDFQLLTQTQLDWATSPAIQADAAALAQFRDLQTFADGPHIIDACGDLVMNDIIAKGIPGAYPALRKYTEGATSRTTAWLRRTNDTTKAERWGSELTTLEGAWPAANLSLVMRAPDPVANPSPFERLEDPALPELANFIIYLGACTPVLSADDGSEVDSFLLLRGEGAMPHSYAPRISHVKNYHHFTKITLDGLADNEVFPQWRQQLSFLQRPLTVVLYPAVDHNGAFHRNLGLQSMVTNSNILTIVVEGLASVADYQSQLAPVASRYGINGEIQQAMIGGHGNANVLQLAGTAGAAIAPDSLGTAGASGTNTTNLMTELTRLLSSDPTRRRIVLDACLTNSHDVASALRASPADAAADVNAAVAANPSLRDFVAGMAGAGANVFGSNSSFAPAQTTFMTPGSTDIGLSVPGDPDLIAPKIQYVEFGTEPQGCMRAVLECWAADQIAGTHDCRDAMLRRIAGTRSAHVPAAHTDTWRESIIQPLYDLAANHYWGNGDAIRQMGTLAGAVFELYWAGHTTPSSLNAALAPLAGNAAHIDQLFTRVSAEPHYTATPRVAVVIEQAWMQHTPARRAKFLAALGRYTTCLEASADVDMGMVMAYVPLLLTVPPIVPPPADQLRLALMVAHHAPVGVPPPSPLPAQAAFLRSLLGAGPTFPAAVGVSAALGGMAGEGDILTDIGRSLAGAAAPLGPAPDANIDTVRDPTARNDFRVTPLHRSGVVATVSGDLMVRSTPTTSTNSNIFNRLPTTAGVFVVGEYTTWYAIEQPGRTGFVAKRYVTLVP